MSEYKTQERQPNEKEPTEIVRDDAVTYTNYPLKNPGDKFGQLTGKFFVLEENLNWEERHKYSDKYIGQIRSIVEFESKPLCFDACVKTVDNIFLSPDEKN